ncbi:MAG: hypothetical protein LAT81_03065, partial [Oceanicaulis sp.]|nr:hypothetical protein [Oceanicaulis sp.]
MWRRRNEVRAIAAAGLALLASGALWAQTPASVTVERAGPVARVLITLPEESGGALTARAEIAAGAVL